MKLFDWKCARHGVFESSHPICPNFGCDSSSVEKVFLKAPGTRSDYTKRFDEGMKKSADMYGQTDWNTARAGESAKANNRSAELKWGEDATEFLGGDLNSALPRGPADGTPAIGFVQQNGPNPLARAERTMESKAADDRKHAELVSAAREANTK